MQNWYRNKRYLIYGRCFGRGRSQNIFTAMSRQPRVNLGGKCIQTYLVNTNSLWRVLLQSISIKWCVFTERIVSSAIEMVIMLTSTNLFPDTKKPRMRWVFLRTEMGYGIYLAWAQIHWSITATPPSLRSSRSSIEGSNRNISGNNLFSSFSS